MMKSAIIVAAGLAAAAIGCGAEELIPLAPGACTTSASCQPGEECVQGACVAAPPAAVDAGGGGLDLFGEGEEEEEDEEEGDESEGGEDAGAGDAGAPPDEEGGEDAGGGSEGEEGTAAEGTEEGATEGSEGEEGLPLPDAGPTEGAEGTEDASVAAPDAGVPDDAGVPIPDAGVPPEDAGVVPQDAGVPDAGVEDGGTGNPGGCTTDSQCKVPTPLCRAGVCVSCKQVGCDAQFQCNQVTGICVVPLKQCQNNVQCDPATEVCGYMEDPSTPGKAVQACVPKNGAKVAGQDCQSGGECQSSQCLSSFKRCYGACLSEADCFQPTSTCGKILLTHQMGTPGDPNDDVQSELTACVEKLTECGDDAPCLPSKRCRYQFNSQTNLFVGVCDDPVGTITTGGPCLKDDMCVSGECVCNTPGCVSASDGYCRAPCNDDADCGNTYTKCLVIKRQLDLNNTPADPSDDTFVSSRECTPGKDCTKDADCNGRACVPTVDSVQANKMVLQCGLRTGTKRGGEGCAKNEDCFTGLCLVGGTCYGACTNDQNCFAPGKKCGEVNIVDTVSGITYNPVPGCIVP